MFKIIFKYSLLFLLLFLMPVGLSAQKKQLSQAKDYIKSGKNLDKAETLIGLFLPTLQKKTTLKHGRCLWKF